MRRARGRGSRAPELVLALGMALVALGAALVGVRVSTFALDESLFHQSALHYRFGFPGSLFNDLTARATTRLYALTLTPIMSLADADVAIRAAKVWNAALFASAAVPVYLMGREVLRSKWAAVAAGLGAIAVPWIVLSTALLSESMAYAAFAWTCWALYRAIRAPGSIRWEAVALVALALAVVARVQLVALIGVWGALVLVRGAVAVPSTAGGLRARAAGFWRGLRAYPLSLGALGAVVALYVYLRTRPAGELTGSYTLPPLREVAPVDGVLNLATESLAFGVGLGLVPFMLALAWLPAALSTREDDAAWWLAVVACIATAGVLAFTVIAQNGDLGPITEERYFVYPACLVWLLALAGLERGQIPAGRAAVTGGALALIAGVVVPPRAFDGESTLLAPVLGFLAELGPSLSGLFEDVGIHEVRPRDIFFVIVALVALGAILALRRRAPARVLLGPAAVMQVAVATWCLLAVNGSVAGGDGRRTLSEPGAFEQQGWIDRAAGTRQVAWLASEPRVDERVYGAVQRIVTFWNDRVRTRLVVDDAKVDLTTSDLHPFDTLPATVSTVAPDGTLASGVPGALVTQWSTSPFAQVAGRTIARDTRSPMELVEPGKPAKLRWMSIGLNPQGRVEPGTTIGLRAWGSGSLTLRVVPAGNDPTRVRGSLGDETFDLQAQRAGVAEHTLRLCGEVTRGTLRASLAAARVDGVTFTPGPRC